MTDTLAYIRVSDPRQAAEDKVSLGVQREAIAELASRMERTIPDTGWYVEPGFSAGTADRPAFQSLIAYCEANPRRDASGLVLCLKDDRWGRFTDSEESAYWRVRLRKAGWVVRFVVSDDTQDPLARGVMRAIGAAQASLERKTIQDRARMGMRGAAAKGMWCNREPFGFRRLAVDSATGATRELCPGQRKGPNEHLKLTPGPANEVAFVQWLFGTYALGATTLDALTREAPTRYPKDWIRRTLHHMLQNPAYAGDIVAGNGAVVTRDAHPSLVDRETFEKVREVLARNRKQTSPTLGGYPLSGLVTCGTCGHAYVGAGGRRGPADNPDLHRCYKDSGAFKRPRCPGRIATFSRRDIEPQVIAAIAGVVERHNVADLIRKAFERALTASTSGVEDQRRALERERDADRARVGRIVKAIGDGLLTEREAQGQVRDVRGRIAAAEGALERLRFDVQATARIESERERLVAMALDFRAQAGRLQGAELRELLRPWLHSAVVNKDARTLTLKVRCLPSVSLFTSARPAPARPCWPAASRRSSPR